MTGLRQLLLDWRTMKRVLGALFLREIQVRWGRRNLGFFWLFAEPLVFAFPVLGMWSVLRPAHEGGLPLLPFLWSGYLPLLIFRHTTSGALGCIRVNAAVMYHRAITPLDIVIGHCGLEIVGNIAAMLFSFFVFYGIGVVDWPANPSLMIAGVLYMAWWSFSVALIVAAVSERAEIVHHIWPPISYMYMPVSGFFFLAAWLPTSVRHVALTVMPSIPAYEMIRGGLFGSRIETYYDIPYLSFILSGLTLIGLWLVRDARRFIEVE